ncbi:homeodomain-only protein isoform X2 [Ambystoma mexicanum]|uniref:homeodomain-only protein isoform X2 n=1 Tax=Ambystoma mexicanum TaxID=8296 RepID=UPI0037E87461
MVLAGSCGTTQVFLGFGKPEEYKMSSLNQVECQPAEDANLAVEQLEILEKNFSNVCRQPDGATLMLIAAEASLSEEETSEWFKRRLAKWRESEGLPAQRRSVTD